MCYQCHELPLCPKYTLISRAWVVASDILDCMNNRSYWHYRDEGYRRVLDEKGYSIKMLLKIWRSSVYPYRVYRPMIHL